jgi:hypothetical protein
MNISSNLAGDHFLSGKYSCLGWLMVALLTAYLYLPLILQGGIITDDWGDIYESINCSTFLQCYADWFPLFSNRPLAPLPITLTTRSFGTHYSLYLLTNSLIYLSALIVTSRTLHPFLSIYSRAVFVLLAAVPCIAMPLIVSPINQLTATVAFLYWAISLNLLIKHCQSRIHYWYFFTYFLLLCGFLTYEIILPLLFFTAFLPAFLIYPKDLNNWLKYFTKFIAPIFGVLILVIFWQKILAPNFIEVYSRLNFNPTNLGRNLFTWIHVYSAQIPKLFLDAIPYISYETLIIFALFAFMFFLLLRKIRKIPSIEPRMPGLPFLIISSGALLASSLIFILTDESAVSWGYQARGLSSTWFALSIWMASIANYSQAMPRIFRAIVLSAILLFTSFSILSFSIQRDKYIESWQLQMQILNDIDNLMGGKEMGETPSVIFNVPHYTPRNYNRELVFSQSWDLPVALFIAKNRRIQSGIVIDSRARLLNGLRIENGYAKVSDGGVVDFNNLWLYDFDSTTKQSSLTQLKNQSALVDQMIKWSSR